MPVISRLEAWSQVVEYRQTARNISSKTDETHCHQLETHPMINAVAYVRMSSDKQEASPKQQREEITN
jgi:hypothetical protein